jgi:hypothetical protein
MIDGYPDLNERETIRTWDVSDGSALELVHYIQSLWAYANVGYFTLTDTADGYTVQMSTAGESGNKSIIEALQANPLFWPMFWRMSKAGGHYTFFIPEEAVE